MPKPQARHRVIMARPREFDETAALDAAVRCFCAHGYEATSVRDLAARMGITGASLYNAFGDKRALYRRALDHYRNQSVRERIIRLESTLAPRQAIQAYFAEIIGRATCTRPTRGCMLVHCALEVAPHDPEFRRIVARELDEIEGFFCRTLRAGQQAGVIAARHSAPDMARLLLGVVLGIRVLAGTRPQKEFLEGVARPALALLGEAAPAGAALMPAEIPPFSLPPAMI